MLFFANIIQISKPSQKTAGFATGSFLTPKATEAYVLFYRKKSLDFLKYNCLLMY